MRFIGGHAIQVSTGAGNKSALLQEVKSVLSKKYTNTDIQGGGPVVVVPFSSYKVELAPAFKQPYSQQYLTPFTDDGGRYESCGHEAEIPKVSSSDDAKAKMVLKMLRKLAEELGMNMADLREPCQ